MTSGICFKIIQKKKKKERKRLNCWTWVGLWQINRIFSLLVKVHLKINIKFYDNKGKEIILDQKQSYLSSNIKNVFSAKDFLKASHCQIIYKTKK